MKTNVPIELDDEQLSRLADLIDNKRTARKATRKEIVELCQRHIGGLVQESRGDRDESGNKLNLSRLPSPEGPMIPADPLHRIDPEDKAILAGKCTSYIRGWNQVKRRGAA